MNRLVLSKKTVYLAQEWTTEPGKATPGMIAIEDDGNEAIFYWIGATRLGRYIYDDAGVRA